MELRRFWYLFAFAFACLFAGCQHGLSPDDSLVQLLSPTNLSYINQACPSFNWNPVPKASYYFLSIATDRDMTRQVLAKTVSTPGYTLEAAESLSPSPDQQYYWDVGAYDGEDRLLGDSARSIFHLDTVAPTLAVTINNGDATTYLERVQISSQVLDSAPCVEMKAGFDKNTAPAVWEPYAARKNATAAAYALVSNATLTAQVQVKDAAGNVSETATDTIELKRTVVSGIISCNTVWEKANGPYVIKGNTTVDANRTLTIKPGVEVLFDGPYYLKIDFLLTAIGTASERILFSNTSKAPPANWDTIYFSPTCQDAGPSGGCTLQYCVIEYGGSGRTHFGSVDEYGAVIASGSSPYLGNCIIRRNRQGVVGAFALLENSYLHDNSLYAIHNGGTLVRNNRIARNGGGIYQPTGQVTKNDIEENGGFGIELASASGGPVTYNRIINNSGEGLFNYWGGAVVNYNDIYGNGRYQYTKFAFHEYSPPKAAPPDDNAKNNYWGTAIESEVSAAVYDYYDTAGSCGKVTFLPFETSAVSGAGSELPPL
jgi:hypothetical protein